MNDTEQRRVERFVEAMGRTFETDGIPRIGGRIVAHLLLSPGPRSLDDLAGTLEVAKASISTNARLLERLGIAERVTLPGDRRDYYGIAPDLHLRLFRIRLDRLEQARELMVRASGLAAADVGAVGDRIERFRVFFDRLVTQLNDVEQRTAGRVSASTTGTDS